MKKNNKNHVFWEEYMIKTWPRPPRFICGSYIHWKMGIVSTSIMLLAFFDKERLDIINKWELESKKYRCYKRNLTKKEWKQLYSYIRRTRKEK